MTMETHRMFIEVWMKNLARFAEGLDFGNEEDRATFRHNVQVSMRNLKWSGMRDVAQHLGADKVPRSRHRALRAITTLYMQRHGWSSKKKSAAQLEAEIAEALAKGGR